MSNFLLFFPFCSDAELTVTLWGNDATAFTVDHLYAERAPNVIVALFLGCVAKKMFSTSPLHLHAIFITLANNAINFIFLNITDKLQISAGSAFQYFLNPDIPEAQPFFSR